MNGIVGKRYMTKRGAGTCAQVTAMQVQVAPDDGEDPYWVAHSALIEEITEQEELAVPSIRDLIDEIMERCALLKMILDEATEDEGAATEAEKKDENV